MSLKSLILSFYIFSSLVVFFILKNTGNYGVAVSYNSVNNLNNININFVFGVIVAYGLMGIFYRIITFKKISMLKLSNKNILDYFITISILINISTLLFGIGKAGGQISSVGFLQSIIPLIPLTSFYFVCVRDSLNRKRIMIIFLSLLVGVLKGWSGHLIVIVLLEVLYRFGTKKVKFVNIIKLLFLLVVVIFTFYFIVALKFYIRSGTFFLIPVNEYLQYVFGRVSYFSTFNYLVEVSKPLAFDIFHERGASFYIQDYILGILPKSLFGLTDFRFLDNIFAVNYINPLLPNAGFSLSLPGLFFITYIINDSIFGLLILVLLSFLMQWILINSYDEVKSKDLIFINLIMFMSSGSLKEIALFNYMLVVFLMFYAFCIFILPMRKI
ncbi:TPA: oligosaccharide repeat unit polymerase [Photobacterium damselae]